MDSFAQNHPDRAVVARPSPNNRSKVSNGSKLVRGVDGRSTDARRYRDIATALADDLGGASGLTEAQRALVQQAATLMVQGERMRGATLRGETVDIEQQTRVANVLARTMNRLGIKRHAPAAKTLAEYAASKGAKAR